MTGERKRTPIIEGPPSNLEAERRVLGSLLLDPAVADDVMAILSVDDFWSDANRRVYKHLKEMRNTGCATDLLLLVDRLQKSGEIEAVGGQDYIGKLMTPEHFVTAWAVYYANIVAEKSQMRRAQLAVTAIQEECQAADATPEKIKQILSDAATELDKQSREGAIDAKQWILEGLDGIDKKSELPISTGFANVDKKLDGGFRRKNLIVLAARPGVGKTTSAGNLIRNICFGQRIPTILFSLEMSRQEILNRTLADVANIYHDRIIYPDRETGAPNRLTDKDWGKIRTTAEKLYELPFFIDDRCGLALSEVVATIRRHVKKHGVKVVFVDQVSLVDAELPSPTASKRDEITAVCIALKRLAGELGIAIVLLSQVNRAAVQGASGIKNLTVEKLNQHRPILENLKESGALEENADVVILLHRPEKLVSPEEAYQLGIVGNAEWIIAKNRHGNTGIVDMRFNGPHFRFTEEERYTTQPQAVKEDNTYANDFARFDGRAAAAGEEGVSSGF